MTPTPSAFGCRRTHRALNRRSPHALLAIAGAAGMVLSAAPSAVAHPSTAAGHGGSTAAQPVSASKTSATQAVNIKFKAVAGTQTVGCDAPITGLGTSKQTANLKDLRFFVSDVKLVRKDGSTATVEIKANKDFRLKAKDGSVTLIDLENGKNACAEEGTAATNAVVSGTVPKGTYVGARWTVGVPFKLSHSNTAGAVGPLGLTAMAWSWQFGRKFVKIELADPKATGTAPTGMPMQMTMPAATAPATPGAWAAPTYFVHVGSTGCVGNPATGAAVSCTASNRAEVRLKTFNAAKQQVAVDIAALLAGNDLATSPDKMPGCMSGPEDPECASEFKTLGITFGAGTKAGRSTGKQSFFRAIAR